MSAVTHLSNVVVGHFSRAEAGAFAHFVTATDGLTGAQAAQVPAERFNSVWAVTNHTAIWQDALRAALVSEELDLATWNLQEMGPGWPPLGEITDTNWEAARQRALDVNQELAAAIALLDEGTLEKPLPNFFNIAAHDAILSIYAHNSYHTAEIIATRHMLQLWVDHPFV